MDTILRQTRQRLQLSIRELAVEIAAPYESLQQLDAGRYKGQPWVIDLLIAEMIKISQASPDTKNEILREIHDRRQERGGKIGRRKKDLSHIGG